MAESVGDIAVRVGADITDLKKGFSDASSAVGSFSSKATAQLRSTTDTIVKMGAAAAAAGAAAVAALYVDAAKNIDAQAKLATALGGTIGGLRAMQMAAGDAQVSSEELSSILVKFNQKLGDAERGTGSAYKALNALGLSAKDFSGLDIDKKMQVLADRVSSLGLSSSQTASLLKDLGIKNENMATLVRNGGDALRFQAEEVKNLGLALSTVDAAKVEMANDAIGIFGDVLTGIQDRLAVAAAPYITVLSEKFREAAIENKGFEKQINSTIDGIISGVGKAADVIHGLKVVFKGVELIAKGFGAAVISVFELASAGVTFFIDKVVLSKINTAIDALNMLPNVDIVKINTLSDSEFMKGLHDLGDTARSEVATVRSELNDLAMQEMPSEKVKQYLKEVQEAAGKAAEATVNARAAVTGGASGVMTKESDDKAAEDAQKKQEAEINAIKNRYMTEEELNRQHRETMALIGDEWDVTKFETEEQWRSIREQAEAEHLERMKELNKSAYEGIQGLIAARWGNAVASTAGAMKSILGTMAAGSRKAFEVSKAWAMADALISTYQGIAAGVRLGWPMGIPAVAWAAATGFAQVSAIKNQSFGGAGGAAASGGGAPATAPNPIGVGGQASSQGQSTTYRFEGLNPGSFVSSDMVVEILKQAQKDGALRGNVMFA